MKNLGLLTAATATSVCLATAANAQLAPYSQDFENLDRTSLTALSDDGWNFFGNVFAPNGDYLFGYGVEPAPNDIADPNISIISETTGGLPPVGTQGLNVFSDYKNSAEHDAGNIVEANVFQEQTITAADIGSVWEFSFVAAPGDDLSGTTTIPGGSPALAFFKTIDPNNSFALTNFVTVDTSALPAGNSSLSVQIDLSDPALEDQLLQFGFLNQSTNFEPTSVNYDNVSFALAGGGGLEGDYNSDGFVSQGDLDLVLLNWGDTVAPAGFNEGNIPGGGPFDSLMSQNELDGVLLNWGDGTPPALSAVPEPTSLALLGLGGLALLRRRA